MDEPKKLKAPPSLRGPSSFHQAVGRAIEAYSNVEGSLALLLQQILKLDPLRTFIIFAAVQNTRSRGELFQELLAIEFDGRLDSHWYACNKFLATLAAFRNALAHWHPHTSLWVNDEQGVRRTHSIGKLVPGGVEHIVEKDIDIFDSDCLYIRTEIGLLTAIVRDGPLSLPEKFQPQAIRQNQAVLRQRQIPKEPAPPRPPSVPKLSPAQKRAKAAKDAREKKT
jgi:hypothetical protein